MAQAPDELSSLAILWTVPAAEPFPPELHGTPIALVAAVYSGEVEHAGSGVGAITFVTVTAQ